ncbi:DotU family type VI secretion system protein [Enterobacillus tribolii]|uniref:Type VI secretion system protein ImpK n=1 Tax=Enterobacillus tribolii TaxID=1487935 RepID=A0A370Q7U0_9GAMM|nr:DotU family type VI secretion system protein [Enterobacillus tribolii]MBW7984908.1 DotU family type VI secretion system protein [Enterobacillus tribolii]RDK84120.1 type VI secretion system protein ImpK [Enterobacillus tribolii]
MTQSTHWDNPLVAAANPLLNAISQIRQSASHANPAQLRQQLIDEMRRFEIRGQRANLSYETIIGARYCLCTALDEAAALTPWGSNSVWSGSGLLVTFHNETWGGEKFFQLLAKLSQTPREHIQLLELINYCLLLGFEGRYRVMDNGRSQLETLKQRLLQLIRSVRGSYAFPLSPNAADLPVLLKRWRPLVPLWACAALAGFLASLLFIVLNWRLGDVTSPVLAKIYQTSLPQVAISNPAPVAPPTMRLRGFLSKEIAEGLVVVRDEAQQSVVILKGDGLFDSGATTVRPVYLPVIDRIAKAMNGVSGKILVTGYTDNVPIRSARFGSNWELSLARAEAVSIQLQKYLSEPERVKAEGRGDSDPVAANDTKENRALNRRVVITLLVAPESTRAELNGMQQGNGQ